MRITKTRIIVQAFFVALFGWLAFVTSFARLKGYPASLLLELDPLVAVGTALSGHTLYRGLIWAVLVTALTFLLGRFFCGWVCPLGTLHHVTHRLLGRKRAETRIESNRYRPVMAFKFYLLAGLLVLAVIGSLQIGLLDPIALLSRSFTTSIWPGLNQFGSWMYLTEPAHRLGWVIGALFVTLLASNLALPRFFCRVLCPLGALLGVFSRFSLWRIDRNPDTCVDCDLCLRACEGASDPHTFLRKAECYVCMNCIDDCPHDALSFRFAPAVTTEVRGPDVTRRRLLIASVMGAFVYPFSRSSGDLTKVFDKAVIRPPGSVAEPRFLERCIKCDQCIRVCPTNVLQPAMFEAGLEGIWTPVLNNRMGYCELNCVLCGQVCPTGAIERITLEEKLGLGAYTGRPVKVGTAFFDRGRCLPWAMDTPCVVCEEVCPTSPKAIYAREVDIVTRGGDRLTLRRPFVDPERCIGCGICEHECPVKDMAGVRVTAIGETRSKDRALLLT
ncbi:MAG: 4Fe-4S dicluster domain-containing protein [Acidobacteria bacterium]|nr:4Fe-4S dicluster domain-containing protein [Acidobacteriota bacterium]